MKSFIIFFLFTTAVFSFDNFGYCNRSSEFEQSPSSKLCKSVLSQVDANLLTELDNFLLQYNVNELTRDMIASFKELQSYISTAELFLKIVPMKVTCFRELLPERSEYCYGTDMCQTLFNRFTSMMSCSHVSVAYGDLVEIKINTGMRNY